jgi:cytochrome c peroxidase
MAAAVAAGVLLLESCRRTDSFVPANPLTLTTPPGFPQPSYNFVTNPISEEGFVLGRKLFYDGRLSIDGNFPCASCHEPRAAFTTFEHDRSHGYNHSHTLRNPAGLFNLAWYKAYRLDGSSTSLEAISQAHITAPDEMGETINGVVNKLKADTAYQRLFREAYGSPEVNSARILKALSQFVINLVSANSKYDKVKRGEASFTATEERGYAVFQSRCSTCHQEPLFTDLSFRNNGLPFDPGLNDVGRMRVTGKQSDSLKFRVPSLRNMEFTSYYGHDGRMNSFQLMLQHYRTGIGFSTTLDPLLQGGIQLSTAQETDLIAFLRTLSDSTFLNNPRFRQ